MMLMVQREEPKARELALEVPAAGFPLSLIRSQAETKEAKEKEADTDNKAMAEARVEAESKQGDLLLQILRARAVPGVRSRL